MPLYNMMLRLRPKAPGVPSDLEKQITAKYFALEKHLNKHKRKEKMDIKENRFAILEFDPVKTQSKVRNAALEALFHVQLKPLKDPEGGVDADEFDVMMNIVNNTPSCSAQHRAVEIVNILIEQLGIDIESKYIQTELIGFCRRVGELLEDACFKGRTFETLRLFETILSSTLYGYASLSDGKIGVMFFYDITRRAGEAFVSPNSDVDLSTSKRLAELKLDHITIKSTADRDGMIRTGLFNLLKPVCQSFDEILLCIHNTPQRSALYYAVEMLNDAVDALLDSLHIGNVMAALARTFSDIGLRIRDERFKERVYQTRDDFELDLQLFDDKSNEANPVTQRIIDGILGLLATTAEKETPRQPYTSSTLDKALHTLLGHMPMPPALDPTSVLGCAARFVKTVVKIETDTPFIAYQYEVNLLAFCRRLRDIIAEAPFAGKVYPEYGTFVAELGSLLFPPLYTESDLLEVIAVRVLTSVSISSLNSLGNDWNDWLKRSIGWSQPISKRKEKVMKETSGYSLNAAVAILAVVDREMPSYADDARKAALESKAHVDERSVIYHLVNLAERVGNTLDRYPEFDDWERIYNTFRCLTVSVIQQAALGEETTYESVCKRVAMAIHYNHLVGLEGEIADRIRLYTGLPFNVYSPKHPNPTSNPVWGRMSPATPSFQALNTRCIPDDLKSGAQPKEHCAEKPFAKRVYKLLEKRLNAAQPLNPEQLKFLKSWSKTFSIAYIANNDTDKRSKLLFFTENVIATYGLRCPGSVWELADYLKMIYQL